MGFLEKEIKIIFLDKFSTFIAETKHLSLNYLLTNFLVLTLFFTIPYVTRKERDCKDDPELIYCENS